MAVAASKQINQAEKNNLYSNGFFQPVTEKCNGCERIINVESNQFCKAYAQPEAKWKNGICNFATHVKPEISAATQKINPLKASKRAMAKKK